MTDPHNQSSVVFEKDKLLEPSKDIQLLEPSIDFQQQAQESTSQQVQP